MEVNLKQARRIETELQNTLEAAGYAAADSETFSSKAEAEKQVELVFSEVKLNLFELTECIFDIRNKIQNANVEHGLNDRIIKIARLEAEKRNYERLMGLNLRASYFDSRKKTQYDVGTSSVRKEVDYTKEINRIKMEISTLKDSCTGTNASKTIHLSELTVKVATDLGLV